MERKKGLNGKNLLPLESWSLDSLAKKHASVALYTVPGSSLPAIIGKDRVYHSHYQLWGDILSEQLRRTDINIQLEAFYLFEWFPRSPGLFHTPDAIIARQRATEYVIGNKEGITIHSPYGKQSMLDGGIGNIRLKPIDIKGVPYYFVSASSNGDADEGFPVAVPSDLFNPAYDEIFSNGAALRTITGQLNFLPGHLADLYDYRGVPKMYLQVKDMSLPGPDSSKRAEALNIRIAASFASAFEGILKTYATYASFNPAFSGELSAAVEWMQDEYVHKGYGGQIITDFDEITPRFNHAPFSLSRVMNRSLDLTGLQEAGLEHIASFILQNQRELNLTIQIQKQQMDTTNFNISGGNIMNLGKEVHVNAPQQQVNQADIDVQTLSTELAKLLEAALRAPDGDTHASEVQAVADAVEAAKKGDKSGAIKHLKSTGKWLFDMASKIGAALAAAVIKQHMGW